MAISGGDGSIILTTKVDESGLKKGLGKMSGLAKSAAKGFAVIGAAAGAATVAITKMAVGAYADYEQLVGGVETLFKDSAGKVLEYANQAFQTAGVSANEYMQQVTSFSASLIRSTAGDTDKAADIANMALIDISDNVNKMGSSMESVTLAYQGFAKQQYMLLDNLKLGYGGTKTEMERLLKDAQALTGVKYDINNLADVYSAIHAIQEQLGITGTTMKEAETTITGSLGMVKASWQNLLTALSGGGDLDRAINNFVYSLNRFLGNIAPVIERTLIGLGDALSKALPMLVQMVAKALIQQIPNLVMAVYNMIIGLFKGIVEGIKALFTGGTAEATEVVKGNVEGISSGASSTADSMSDVAKNTKKAGKEAKKALASFDDLSILANAATGGGENGETASAIPSVGVAGGAGAGGGLLGVAETEVDKQLQTIMGYVGGALVAIGIILICFGHIAWGISFIVAGALTFTKAQASLSEGEAAKKSKDTMNAIITGISLLALVLGIILVTAGVALKLGIGLIVSGAVGLATEVALNWDSIKNSVSSFFENNTGLIIGVATAILVLGVILCLVGVVSPLSIGLIASGAAILATEVALNWDATKKAVSDFLHDNKELIVGVSLAILVLGIIMCCVGLITPLSIGLIVFGAAGLATEVALNWDYMVLAVSKFIDDNMGLIVGVSSALLVLGIILVCTGVALPFGIALIAAGAVGLITPIVMGWDAIVGWVSGAWDAVCGFWNTYIAPIFTLDWWINLGKKAFQGLIDAANWVLDKIKGIFGYIGDAFTDAFDGVTEGEKEFLKSWKSGNFSTYTDYLAKKARGNAPRTRVPGLARGAVIPPNRQFLAVLGDQTSGVNIEAPLDTIVEAFNIALAQNGGAGSGNSTVVLELDGRELGKAVLNEGNRENRRVGTRLVIS